MKPILFNTEMVKAIIEGRKTVTRRKVKFPKWVVEQDKELGIFYVTHGDGYYGDCGECGKEGLIDYAHINPYEVGDILYVREAALIQSMSATTESVKMLFQDGELHSFKLSKKEYERLLKYADSNKFLSPYWLTKQEARIFLKVTDVRVERLQDIEEHDVFQEGLEPFDDRCADENWRPTLCDPDSGGSPQMIQGFEILWNSTVKKTDLDQFGWDANPWVWVIEFERCEKEVE